MISIKKFNEEPKALSEFRAKVKRENGKVAGKDYLSFRDLPEFRDLKKSLLKEQKYLCCYCMVNIDENSMVVEHFLCRERYGEYALTYSNLLASCKGCTNQSDHCDKNKGNQQLSKIPNPADSNIKVSQIISYTSKGEITIRDGIASTENEKTEFLLDLNKILNLNNEDLIKARTDAANIFINKFKSTNKMPKMESEFIPFWGFVEFLLRKKNLI